MYGDIKSAKLILDRETGKSKGFGFIEMSNDVEAQETIDALNGVSIKGKKLSVQKAEERPPSGNSFNRNSDNRFNRR